MRFSSWLLLVLIGVLSFGVLPSCIRAVPVAHTPPARKVVVVRPGPVVRVVPRYARHPRRTTRVVVVHR